MCRIRSIRETAKIFKEMDPQTEITETEAPEYVDVNKQLDDIIRILKRQLKEKERLLKHQNRKTTQKKKTTQNNRPKQKKKSSTENR